MEEEESAPIVAPVQRSNIPLAKRKAWNEQPTNKELKQDLLKTATKPVTTGQKTPGMGFRIKRNDDGTDPILALCQQENEPSNHAAAVPIQKPRKDEKPAFESVANQLRPRPVLAAANIGNASRLRFCVNTNLKTQIEEIFAQEAD